jgi:hypothetical protein
MAKGIEIYKRLIVRLFKAFLLLQLVVRISSAETKVRIGRLGRIQVTTNSLCPKGTSHLRFLDRIKVPVILSGSKPPKKRKEKLEISTLISKRSLYRNHLTFSSNPDVIRINEIF